MQHYIGGMASQIERKQFHAVAMTARKQGAIITTHDIPDVDGVGGAFALQKHLSGNGGRIDIVTGKTIQLTDPLVERLGVRLKSWSEIPSSDSRPMIVVDTSTASLLNSAAGRKNTILAVIDHHRLTSVPLDPIVTIRNRRAISVCEILASLIPSDRIDRSSALALAVGIAGDSEKLLDTDKETLHIFERLASRSKESKLTIDTLAYPPLRPETLSALLGDMKHLRTEVYRGKVIAIGKTTQEIPALFARMLKDMNVNVAVAVGRIGKDIYKLSFRVRYRDAIDGISASEIARKTSEGCGMRESMWGGGHIEKAGAVIHGAYESIVATAIRSAMRVIDKASQK